MLFSAFHVGKYHWLAMVACYTQALEPNNIEVCDMLVIGGEVTIFF
jgi:hypothetical protein